MKNCGFSFDTTYTNLPKQFFTKLSTDTVGAPDIVVINNELSVSLGLDFSKFNDPLTRLLISGFRLGSRGRLVRAQQAEPFLKGGRLCLLICSL